MSHKYLFNLKPKELKKELGKFSYKELNTLAADLANCTSYEQQVILVAAPKHRRQQMEKICRLSEKYNKLIEEQEALKNVTILEVITEPNYLKHLLELIKKYYRFLIYSIIMLLNLVLVTSIIHFLS